MGQASVLVVGGVSEALNAGSADIQLTLRRRRGFVKLALRFGRPIVPVFAFGENFLYENLAKDRGSVFR